MKRGSLTSFFKSVASTSASPPDSTKKMKSGEKSEQNSVRCPFCNSPFGVVDIEAHVAMHIATEEDGKISQKEVSQPNPPPMPHIIAAAASSSSSSSSSKSNVFATMMASSQLQNPKKVTFSLILDKKTGKLTPIFQMCDDPSLEQHVSILDANTAAWTAQVKIKGLKVGATKRELLVHLYTNIPSELSPSSVTPKASISTSILKSMLQKAVRRRKGNSACRLAYELLKASPNDLLRRLPIIMVEDASMHPGMPVLVFCMLADSKGYHLSPYLVLIIMQVLAEMTLCPVRDIRERHKEEDIASIDTLPPHSACRCVIVSLLFRLSFGGMMGDAHMLNDACCSWNNRLSKSETEFSSFSSSYNLLDTSDTLFCESYLDPQYLSGIRNSGKWGFRMIERFSRSNLLTGSDCIDSSMAHDLDTLIKCYAKDKYEFNCLNKLFKLDKMDLVPEGICFHCDFQLVPYVMSKLGMDDRIRLDEEKIKSLIWLFRASVNNHKNDSMDSIPDYTEIQVTLNEKRNEAKNWSIIAKYVKSYCEEKKERLWRSYTYTYPCPTTTTTTTK